MRCVQLQQHGKSCHSVLRLLSRGGEKTHIGGACLVCFASCVASARHNTRMHSHRPNCCGGAPRTAALLLQHAAYVLFVVRFFVEEQRNGLFWVHLAPEASLSRNCTTPSVCVSRCVCCPCGFCFCCCSIIRYFLWLLSENGVGWLGLGSAGALRLAVAQLGCC